MTVQVIIHTAFLFIEPPLFSVRERLQAPFSSARFKSVAGDPLSGGAQYAGGGEKPCSGAFSDEISEMSRVRKVRSDHLGEAIESAPPPLEKRDGMEAGFKYTPPRFYQTVYSPLYGHCFLPLSITGDRSVQIQPLRLVTVGLFSCTNPSGDSTSLLDCSTGDPLTLAAIGCSFCANHGKWRRVPKQIEVSDG